MVCLDFAVALARQKPESLRRLSMLNFCAEPAKAGMLPRPLKGRCRA
jgi:hypothetical protein